MTSPLHLATALYFLPMVPMLWHSAETPNPGTMAWSAQTQDNGWPLNKDGSCHVPYFWRIFFHEARNRVGAYFKLLFLGYGFLIHLSNRSGTVFIQGPSIVLLVWRSIMFNGSFLRACRILRIVQKIRFSPSWVWADQAMVPGFGVSAECQSIGTSGKK